MRRFIEDIRMAQRRGRLPEHSRASDVRDACPGSADHTYGVFYRSIDAVIQRQYRILHPE
jgi:hypothetical protein